MQLARISPTSAAPASVTPERAAAAQQLLVVPMGVMLTGMAVGMGKAMAGQQVSRAELVAPFLAQLSPDAAGAAILTAVEGAVAVAPELAPRSEAMRQCAAAIAALLVSSAADTDPVEAGTALDTFGTEFATASQALLEAAALLDPEATSKQPVG